MICPDVNLLLYAVNDLYPQHAKAKCWWDSALSGAEPVGLGHVVVLGFVRISTNKKIFDRPLTILEATTEIDSWLKQPCVEWINPSSFHWDTYKAMLLNGKAGSNLTTDAHIATLASEVGATVYSNDTNFDRFPGLKVVNPLMAS